jgi:hypothetical protein
MSDINVEKNLSMPKFEILTDEISNYLDDLRASGVTNMMGSPAYVEKQFGITWDEANTAVVEWMESFK